jgi:hypothetical protein
VSKFFFAFFAYMTLQYKHNMQYTLSGNITFISPRLETGKRSSLKISISIRVEILTHKTSLIPSISIEVPVSAKKVTVVYLCVSGIYFAYLAILIFDVFIFIADSRAG